MAQGEGQCLDFKFEVSDASKIARSLVAFANTDGGTLLIGVKDNGNISGIRSEEEYYMVQNAAERYCKPEIAFTSKEWNMGGKKVLEIKIPASKIITHKAPDPNNNFKAYLRVNDENILAPGIQMKIWKKLNNNRSIKFVYTDNVKDILAHINENSKISICDIQKKSKLTKFKTDNILAELIIMKTLNLHIEVNNVYLSLNDKPENDY
ncbi:MAG: ATP-binding protein [Bacteroidales bacterium]|nr:ATP-binding protein [Bacteroidales bacterium]MDG1900894.1 ATP-binding protein [Bacteroidales bacterium]MDG2081732.1 ATP-binding protein [Bacteroidales bacterium]